MNDHRTAPYDGDNLFAIMNARLTGVMIAPQAEPGVTPEMEEIILHALERNPSVVRLPSIGRSRRTTARFR